MSVLSDLITFFGLAYPLTSGPLGGRPFVRNPSASLNGCSLNLYDQSVWCFNGNAFSLRISDANGLPHHLTIRYFPNGPIALSACIDLVKKRIGDWERTADILLLSAPAPNRKSVDLLPSDLKSKCEAITAVLTQVYVGSQGPFNTHHIELVKSTFDPKQAIRDLLHGSAINLSVESNWKVVGRAFVYMVGSYHITLAFFPNGSVDLAGCKALVEKTLDLQLS